MHLSAVIDQLKSMRLSTMAEALSTRLKNGVGDLLPEEFVALLVEDEYNARQHRKLSRMIGRANFKPEQATLENILYEPGRGFTKKDMAMLSTTTWIDHAQNIIITGPTGCGKTYLAEAVGFKACTLGFPVLKIRYPLFFEEVRVAKGTGQYLRYLKKTSKNKVIIIDDFLMHTIAEADMAPLMDVIEEKEQTGSIVVTTQFPVDVWHQKLPDPTTADAICDRLIQAAIRLDLNGDSMRKTKQKSQSK